MTKFKNREEAGLKLAAVLSSFLGDKNTLVLGLPRGGVVVAQQVAARLHLPLDVIATRKIGAPGNPELAIGAVNEFGDGVFDHATIERYGISPEYLSATTRSELTEIKERESRYHATRPACDINHKTVILVDDGIATGYTMRAAIAAARTKGASRVVVAAPVAARDTLDVVGKEADEVYCLAAPEEFYAVGQWYEEFPQTTHEEVIELMRESLA